MLQLVSFQSALYFRHLYYFSWDHVFQGAFSLQGALFYSGRFYFIQGAFILFRALYSSCKAPFCSCIALYSVFCVSQLLYFYFSSKLSCSFYFNFLMWSAYLLISVMRFLMIKRLVAICHSFWFIVFWYMIQTWGDTLHYGCMDNVDWKRLEVGL